MRVAPCTFSRQINQKNAVAIAIIDYVSAEEMCDACIKETVDKTET